MDHQLLMLKSLNKERRIRQEERIKEDMEHNRWDKKAVAITKNIDSVYPNGIESGAGTHVSLALQNLQRDQQTPIEMECGLFAQIGIASRSKPKQTYTLVLATEVFCEYGDNHRHQFDFISRGSHQDAL